MTLLLPFHQHEAEGAASASCELCSSHKPHSGHLESAGHLDNCLICQFLGITFLDAESAGAASPSTRSAGLVAAGPDSVTGVPLQSLPARAPPCSCC